MFYSYFPTPPDDARAMENPALQLYGNRFYTDQTISELLVEFLLVVFSPKRFGNFSFTTPLPPLECNWETKDKLEYAPHARLNLKLFSFLGASRLDSRHSTHRSHHADLVNQLLNRIHIADAGDKKDILRAIENLFLGFQGAGSGRTWCAQSFMPISPALLAGETIWNESVAKNKDNIEWQDVLENLNTFFSMNRHRFLGRGGELLYLQVCNALRQPKERISQWATEVGSGLFSDEEQNPTILYSELSQALAQLMSSCPKTLTDIAEFIDTHIDTETPSMTDEKNGERRFVSVGWCNEESWQEGYIFAVELLRLLRANLDVIDRIYLLESACAMQVLRSLAMQSTRVMGSDRNIGGPGYRLVVSAPEEKRPLIKRLSRHSVKEIEKNIFQSLRSDKVMLNYDGDYNKILKQADNAYGSRLFTLMGKRIGLIVPKRGTGTRFILTENLLRLLVVTTVPHKGRLTFDTFKELLEQRHGFVFDANGVDRACQWLGEKGTYLPTDTDKWLQDMLEAAGFLIHLSDSCALVHNPTDA